LSNSDDQEDNITAGICNQRRFDFTNCESESRRGLFLSSVPIPKFWVPLLFGHLKKTYGRFLRSRPSWSTAQQEIGQIEKTSKFILKVQMQCLSCAKERTARSSEHRIVAPARMCVTVV
jgi:hypothetical protein